MLNIVEHVVLAEFDILHGSCVRTSYPNRDADSTDVEVTAPNGAGVSLDNTIPTASAGRGNESSLRLDASIAAWEEYFADHMLPDGAEKKVVTKTVFVVNRPKRRRTHTVEVHRFVLAADAVTGSHSTGHDGRSDLGDVQRLASGDGASALASGGTWRRSAQSSSGACEPEVLTIDVDRGCISLSGKDGSIAIPAARIHSADVKTLGELPLEIRDFAARLPRAAHWASTSHSHSSAVTNARNDTACGGLTHLAHADPAADPGTDDPRAAHGLAFVVLLLGGQWEGFLVAVEASESLRSALRDAIRVAVVSERTEGVSGAPSCSDAAYGASLGGGDVDDEVMDGPAPLFGLCAVVTKTDSTVQRGAINKSVAILGRCLAWLEPFFPLLVDTALRCCDIKGTEREAIARQRELLEKCFVAINALRDDVMAARQARTLLDAVPAPPSTAVPVEAVGSGLHPAQVAVLVREVRRMCLPGGSSAATASTHASVCCAPFGTWFTASLPLQPLWCDVSLSSFSLEALVEMFGASLFSTLLPAMFAEKRIVALSRQGNPAMVCDAALSLGVIGSLIDAQFIAKKVFPYVSVDGLQHCLDTPGYIVGTVNPIFESQRSWWDVLCDLDNRCVTMSAATERELKQSLLHLEERCGGEALPAGGGWREGGVDDATACHARTASTIAASRATEGPGAAAVELRAHQGDEKVTRDLISRINHLRALQVRQRDRLLAITLFLEEYLHLMVAAGIALSGAGAGNPVPAEKMMHVAPPRTAQAQQGPLFSRACATVLRHGEPASFVMDIASLRRSGALGDMELLRTLQRLLRAVRSDEAVLLLLRRMPAANGGLDPIGAQLFHPSVIIRITAVTLLRRIETAQPLGNTAIATMRSFFVMAYAQALRTLPASAE